jgi:hypothetical protein
MLDLQHVLSGLPNLFCDLVAVDGAEKQGAQNQHIERTLQEINAVCGTIGHGAGRYSTRKANRMVETLLSHLGLLGRRGRSISSWLLHDG